MTTSTNKNNTTFNLELTPEQLFVVHCALEQFRDIKDSEYHNVTEIAGELLGRLPETGIKWDDVAS